MADLPDLAKRLRHFAAKAGITSQTEFATKSGFSPSAVSLWFTGKVKPTYENLEAICKKPLGIDLPTFFGPYEDDVGEPSDDDGEAGKSAAAV